MLQATSLVTQQDEAAVSENRIHHVCLKYIDELGQRLCKQSDTKALRTGISGKCIANQISPASACKALKNDTIIISNMLSLCPLSSNI